MNSPSHQKTKIRLLVDRQPNSGQRNMAIDETLLQFAKLTTEPTMRLYEWSEPTISLGYFQKASLLSSESQFHQLAHVRRLSGGGAILHHHELTYSFIVPHSHILAKEPNSLYPFIHNEIIKSLKTFQIQSAMRSQPDKAADSNFLCFGRGDANDIMINNHKVVGSAQRRRKGNILQHGSMLLKTSEQAPDFPGLQELTKQLFPLEEFKKTFIKNISEALSVETFLSELTFDEEQYVEKLIKTKYSLLSWDN